MPCIGESGSIEIAQIVGLSSYSLRTTPFQ